MAQIGAIADVYILFNDRCELISRSLTLAAASARESTPTTAWEPAPPPAAGIASTLGWLPPKSRPNRSAPSRLKASPHTSPPPATTRRRHLFFFLSLIVKGTPSITAKTLNIQKPLSFLSFTRLEYSRETLFDNRVAGGCILSEFI